MQPIAKKLFQLVLALTLSVPLGMILTLLLLPLWSWLESAWGIESIGHSGPDEWCFVASLVVTAAIGGWLALRS